MLRDLVGPDVSDADEEWLVDQNTSAVLIGMDRTVAITSSQDLKMLSMWFSMAAQWLEAYETNPFDGDVEGF